MSVFAGRKSSCISIDSKVGYKNFKFLKKHDRFEEDSKKWLVNVHQKSQVR